VFILAKLGDADEIFLWLAMALTAIAAANVLSAAGGGRYTLGWTLGRLSWVISASVLFLYFMRQYARHQRLLVRTAEVLEQRVAARTSELEASNARLERSLDERNVLLRDVEHKTVALTESRARLAGVVDSAMDAIISVDERHQVVLSMRRPNGCFNARRSMCSGENLVSCCPPGVGQHTGATSMGLRRWASPAVRWASWAR
jgi:hypothetical protein